MTTMSGGVAMSIMNRLPWKRGKQSPENKPEAESALTLLQDDVNNLFDRFWRGSTGLSPLWSQDQWRGFTPSVDVVETDEAIKISAELPGLTADDIELQLADDALLLRGEKRHEETRKGHNYYRTERSYGAFSRRIPLPASVKPDEVDATLRDGLLTISLAKAESTDQRKIEIKKSEA
jgi:HSP20 family protein